MDIYGNFIDLRLVIHLIKEINKVISDNKMSQWKKVKLIYILEVKINIAIDSIIIAAIETLLNIISIIL